MARALVQVESAIIGRDGGGGLAGSTLLDGIQPLLPLVAAHRTDSGEVPTDPLLCRGSPVWEDEFPDLPRSRCLSCCRGARIQPVGVHVGSVAAVAVVGARVQR